MLHYILTTIGLRRDVVDPHWDDYIFDDEEPPRPDKFKSLTEGNFPSLTSESEPRPWTDDEKKFSLSAALDSIPDGHPSSRCKVCQKIDTSSSYGFGHHRYPVLEKSATLGCPLCEFFVANIRKVDTFCSADLTIDPDTSTLWYKHAGYPATPFELFTERGDHEDASNHIFLRNIWPDPFQVGCFNVAQNWLASCTVEHERCKQSKNISVPTRLLDISETCPILCTKRKNVAYAALSYCWGQDMAVTTTKANFQCHEKGIEYGGLPKTFQDAISVTRALGIDFLWVDSLCIIQDDEDDWDTECVRMGEYYENAYVTISALSASGSSEGFLHPRPETQVLRLFETSNVYIRPRKDFNRRKIFESAALSRRGWTLQERLLSTRILHFSSYEMFWECKTCSAREGSAKEHINPVDSRSLSNYEGDDFKRVLQHMDRDPHSPSNGAFAVWYRLVRQYTRRSLSRSSDLLPAISALASAFSTITGYTYMAGLWAEDSQSLLWLKDRGQSGSRTYHSYPREADNYRAPSWSWAAVDGAVVFAPYEEERTFSTNDASIIHQRVEPHGSSKFRAILRGSITLRALSKNVRCESEFVYSSESEESTDGFTPEYGKLEAEYYKIGFPAARYWLRIFDVVGKHFA
ncbi:HET-domain-containing protein [Hyaloscypha variabilis F]|uniref:HET-domain-containing protein n=1 Tax=Hyaloscypha variabilis (strain UAMH 11265 / GT02V1 / F) TaxID=1149755 RepID=A0A2J6RHJ3_HYAVF|nr:HET-domain-containing protein [Hyaloscypha variabilis F]